MPSFLNQFPAEIIHIIFGYLWAHEILNSFRNINIYLNRILSNYNHYLINFESIRKSHFDLVCRYIRPEQAISLILSDKMETPYQSELFRSFFSIEQFIHLRSLKLIELDDDGESFFSDLYKVQSLMSLEIDIRIQLPVIKSSPRLKRLIINLPPGAHFNIDSSIAMVQFEHIRQLSLSECSCAQLKQIFRQAIRLTSLKISFTLYNPIEFHAFTNFYHEQTAIPTLVSLSLSIDGAEHLRKLELITFHGAEREFVDAYRWEIFLTEHLRRLLIFNFKFFSWDIEQDVIDQYRCPFWLNKHWYVACDSGQSSLFTVPHFAPSSMNDSCDPVSPDFTTLPIEQHHIFYDSVTELTFDSEQYKLPYRYNHVKKFLLDTPYTCNNALDLSKVESFIVNTSDWSFYGIIILIKKAMPSVNYLKLNCTYPVMRSQYFARITLEQVRILSLPQYGEFEGKDPFNWSRLFPCVERLIAAINSRKQIRFLIDQFKNMISGFFCIHPYHMDRSKQIQITRQWLKKHTYRFKGKNMNNFICQIENKYLFSLSLWIGDNNKLDQQRRAIRENHWWHQCFS